MKLFEMKTEDAASVLCEITPRVDNIVQDEEIISVLSTAIDTKDKSRASIAMETLRKLTTVTPLLLQKHKKDVFGIMAAVEQKDIKAISEQPFRETVAQAKDLFSDEDLLIFFGLSKPRGKSV